ncbi:MAG: amidohydrolase [Bacteroidetes bacterium]|nr:amidohydrolase [Bacteroidota bacterium]
MHRLKTNLLSSVFTFFTVLISCSAPKQKADLIITNAVVYTVDSIFSVYESFAVQDGKFIAVGTTGEITGKFESEQVLDLKGKFVYPGFIDGHCHFEAFGLKLLDVIDLRGDRSFDEIVGKVASFPVRDSSAWIVGHGWNQNEWPVKQFPDRSSLDSLLPETPVLLKRIDGHAVLANGKALELGRITPDTIIEGGKIEVKNGRCTGILLDNAADHLKKMITIAYSDKMEALRRAEKACLEAGLTTLVDAWSEKETILMIDSLQKAGEMKIRVCCMLSTEEKDYPSFFADGPYVTDRLHIGAIKLYADGALGSRGAKLMKPYNDDPDNTGLLTAKPEYFREFCRKAYDNGFQVCTHAIGDSAVRLMLNIYAEFLKGKNDCRWLIEHAQIVHPDDFEFFGKYSVIPSVQTKHAVSDMSWAEERVGKERLAGAYAYRRLLEQNGWLVNGTDFPVEDINPVISFYTAVTRKDRSGLPAGGFLPENALTREQALRAMTLWAAKGSFEEKDKGSIEAGKYADFVVLDTDLMKTTEKDIPGTSVLRTFINGVQVFMYKKAGLNDTGQQSE